jgi:hypothetical protein
MRKLKTNLVLLTAISILPISGWSEELRKTAGQNIVQTLQTINPPKNPTSPTTGCGPESQVPGCSAMLENFCSELVSPTHKGSQDLTIQGKPVAIRFGTAKNGQNETFYAFEKAKFDNQKDLPPDLYQKLTRRGYFAGLKKILDNNFNGSPTKRQEFEQNRQLSQLSSIWNQCMEDIALARTEKLHPGYSDMRQIPREWQDEFSKQKAELDRAAFKAIWEKSPGWKKVVSEFAFVKEQYIKDLEDDPKLSKELKDDWIKRIKSVEIAMPGADEDASDEPNCAIDLVNGFYNRITNKITVCAGYFNGTEIQSLFAHEFSHALDNNRTMVLFQRNSELAKRLNQMTALVCKNAPLPKCPSEWTHLKSEMQKLADQLDNFKPQVPELFSCLQYKDIKETPSAEFLQQTAKSVAIQDAGEFSSNDAFFSLVSRELVLDDGQKIPNANYLNPCGNKTPELDNVLPQEHMKTFFTLEYICDSSGKSGPARNSAAVASAKRFQALIAEKIIPMGGKFSSNDYMIKNGYAEPPEERFADIRGSKVFARILKSMPLPEDRKKAFFANTAEKCTRPSLMSAYPEDAQAFHIHSLETHSIGKQRRFELMNEPIRNALGCAKDYSYEDCSL